MGAKEVFFEAFRTDFEKLWQWVVSAPGNRGHCLALPTMVTLSKQGPAARTVVLRDVDERDLIFFTDCRSPKVEQIKVDSRTCMHAYDAANRFQIQLHGSCSIVDKHPKLNHWRAIGLQRFGDYGSQAPPGVELPLENAISKELASTHFVVLRLEVACIELLKLRREGHWRVRWNIEKQRRWITELVP